MNRVACGETLDLFVGGERLKEQSGACTRPPEGTWLPVSWLACLAGTPSRLETGGVRPRRVHVRSMSCPRPSMSGPCPSTSHPR